MVGIALVAGTLALVGAAQAAQAPIRVVGFASIGTFKVRGGTPAKARAAFGTPIRVHELSDSCTITWPGIEIGFYSLVTNKQCLSTTPFGGATITRAWITDRGLRQGDSLARAKQLYPSARKRATKGSSGNVPLVVRFSQAIGEYGLTGDYKNGKMTTLHIDDPQGGE